MPYAKSSIFAAVLLAVLPCAAQTPQPAVTPHELKYFTFVLTQIAAADQPKVQATMDRHLFHLYGLNNQEIAILRGASLELRALLQQLSPAVRSIGPDPSGKLTAANQAMLSALATQRDQKVEVLANRILNQVRPQVAALFRLNGRILSSPANRPAARR